MLLSRTRYKCSGHAEEIEEVRNRRSASQEGSGIACRPAPEHCGVKSIQTPAHHSFCCNQDSVILRCSPSSASLEGWATGACGSSFETPRKSAAPQDDG